MKKLDFDPTLKAQWVTALRSGDYIQGKSALQYGGNYCCLGVLCEVMVKNGSDLVTTSPLGIGYRQKYHMFGFVQNNTNIADEVRQEIGLKNVIMARLMTMNDGGKSFEQIADYIEKKL